MHFYSDTSCTFINTNVPDERIEVLLSEKELNESPNDSPNILKKLNIDRLDALLFGEYYRSLDNYCSAEFSAYYTINNKPDHSSKYQSDKLQNKLIGKNHAECGHPKQIKLIKSQTKMEYRKNRRTHELNTILDPEKYAIHLLFLFHPLQDEKELLSGCPPSYQNKLLEPGVQTSLTYACYNVNTK